MHYYLSFKLMYLQIMTFKYNIECPICLATLVKTLEALHLWV